MSMLGYSTYVLSRNKSTVLVCLLISAEYSCMKLTAFVVRVSSTFHANKSKVKAELLT